MGDENDWLQYGMGVLHHAKSLAATNHVFTNVSTNVFTNVFTNVSTNSWVC